MTNVVFALAIFTAWTGLLALVGLSESRERQEIKRRLAQIRRNRK